MNIEQLLMNHNINCGINGSGKNDNPSGNTEYRLSEKLKYENTYQISEMNYITKSIYNLTDTCFIHIFNHTSTKKPLAKFDVATNTHTILNDTIVFEEQRYPMFKFIKNDNIYYIYGKYVFDSDFNLLKTMSYPLFLCPVDNNLYYGYTSSSSFSIYKYDIATDKSTLQRKVFMSDLISHSSYCNLQISMNFYHNFVFLTYLGSSSSASYANSRYTQELWAIDIFTTYKYLIGNTLMYFNTFYEDKETAYPCMSSFYNKYNDKFYLMPTCDPHWNNDNQNYYLIELTKTDDTISHKILLFETIEEDRDTYANTTYIPSPDDHLNIRQEIDGHYKEIQYIAMSKDGIKFRTEILMPSLSGGPNGISPTKDRILAVFPHMIITGGNRTNKYNKYVY